MGYNSRMWRYIFGIVVGLTALILLMAWSAGALPGTGGNIKDMRIISPDRMNHIMPAPKHAEGMDRAFQDIPHEYRMAERLEPQGTHFEVENSSYLNITLESSEPVNVTLESTPEMVTMHIESASAARSAIITLSGFVPNTMYHKYEDDYHNHTAFTTDANGKYSYVQDLSASHLVFIQPRPSTKFINDNATGGDCTLIGTWDSAAKICTMTTDVDETIQIDSDGVTLDGGGHALIGTGTGSGVYLNGRTGVMIKKMSISGFVYGIYLVHSSNNTLSGNIASNNDFGLYLDFFSNNNSLSGNIESNNGWIGIYLYESGNNTLRSNIASNNYGGIHLDYSSNNTLMNNVMTENKYNFGLEGVIAPHFQNQIDTSNSVNGKPIYYIKGAENTIYDSSTNAGTFYCIDCINVTIKDLSLTKNDYGVIFINTTFSTIQHVKASNNDDGIHLNFFSNNNTLISNNASNNFFTGFLLYSSSNMLNGNIASNSSLLGFLLYSSTNNTLIGNIASNNNDGIILDSSSNNALISNIASNNSRYGIYLHYFSNNNSLSDNNASNNFDGITLLSSVNNTLSGNNASNNSLGIYLYNSSNNSLSGNNASNNSEGIDLVASSSNTLSSNIVSNNNISINLSYSSNNNRIYHNNFIKNIDQAYDSGNANLWDNDYPSGGNYWSDYTGTDSDGDGIGDTPYNISGGSADRYPLMKPFSEIIPLSCKIAAQNPNQGPVVVAGFPAVQRVNVDSIYGAAVRINLFVREEDGNLWERFWDGSKWTWSDTGKSVAGDPVILVRGNVASVDNAAVRINLFVNGSDGRLWERFWDGSKWTWSDTGLPVYVAGEPIILVRGNVASVDNAAVRINLFVRGADGNLWERFWDGSKWTWE